MQKYSIYCTPEQTKRAYNLGAPIGLCYKATGQCETGVFVERKNKFGTLIIEEIRIPTTEQLCGWLREKGIRIEIFIMEHEYDYRVEYGFDSTDLHTYEMSYKQAILAAIDEALDYLEKGGNK